MCSAPDMAPAECRHPSKTDMCRAVQLATRNTGTAGTTTWWQTTRARRHCPRRLVRRLCASLLPQDTDECRCRTNAIHVDQCLPRVDIVISPVCVQKGIMNASAAANGAHGSAAQQQLPPPPPMGRGRGAVQPAWMANGASDPVAPGRPGGAVCCCCFMCEMDLLIYLAAQPGHGILLGRVLAAGHC